MAEDEAFADYVQRLRAGEEKAATDLVQRYEPIIRREIRLRLSNPSVYRVLDDQDVCQSVLASFFVRASLGQYDLTDVAQLKQLLLGMARNKLAHAARRQLTRKRGAGRQPHRRTTSPWPAQAPPPAGWLLGGAARTSTFPPERR